MAAAEAFYTEVPDFALTAFDVLAPLWWIVDHQKYEEVRGIVETVNSPKVTLARGILLNTLYELQAWCTSIVAQTPLGEIIHARNLDFDFADNMRKITYRAHFKQGDESIF